jgi:membrane protease YdiL (CAAX protease family)
VVPHLLTLPIPEETIVMIDTVHSTDSTRTAEPPDLTAPVPQYSLPRILATWAAAALPMAVLAWVVAPRLAETFDGPTAVSRALILCLAAGMLWQFVLVLVLVRREQGSLRWSTVKDALWLHAPRSPRTGRRSARLWWVLVPMILAIAGEKFLPTLPTPAARDLSLFLGSSAGQTFLSGNWVWLTVLVAGFFLNTVLGEELLFRGLLLPRMQGAFGKWDWLANGVLFALYHLHVPWVIPQTILVDTFALAYPSRRYRSALLGIATHSAQSVFFTVLVVGLVLR